MRAAAVLVLVLLILAGCAPVLLGGLIWHSTKSKHEKSLFIANLNQTNAEREAAGLKPLDRCREIFFFDPGWAMDLPECQKCADSLRALGYGPKEEKKSAFPSKWDDGQMR